MLNVSESEIDEGVDIIAATVAAIG